MEIPETWAWDTHDMLDIDDEREIAERTEKISRRSPEGEKLHNLITEVEELVWVEDEEGNRVMPVWFE